MNGITCSEMNTISDTTNNFPIFSCTEMKHNTSQKCPNLLCALPPPLQMDPRTQRIRSLSIVQLPDLSWQWHQKFFQTFQSGHEDHLQKANCGKTRYHIAIHKLSIKILTNCLTFHERSLYTMGNQKQRCIYNLAPISQYIIFMQMKYTPSVVSQLKPPRNSFLQCSTYTVIET